MSTDKSPTTTTTTTTTKSNVSTYILLLSLLVSFILLGIGSYLYVVDEVPVFTVQGSVISVQGDFKAADIQLKDKPKDLNTDHVKLQDPQKDITVGQDIKVFINKNNIQLVYSNNPNHKRQIYGIVCMSIGGVILLLTALYKIFFSK
jgi:hypothetical protein